MQIINQNNQFLKMKTKLLLVFFNIIFITLIQGQCPTSVSISTNSKCISVNPGNSSTTITGYTYLSGSNPAIFYESTGNSSGCNSYSGYSGNLTINGNSCTYVNGALPVTFSSFDTKLDGDQVVVSFSTSSESNNDFFEIQRSANGEDYSTIGNLAGTGNSNEERFYKFYDSGPLFGLNYYRIKQVDFDGKYAYSDIRSVLVSYVENAFINAYIRDNTLEINTSFESYDVSIFNHAGQQVKKIFDLTEKSVVDIHELPSGMYYISIHHFETTQTMKVVKF